VNRRTIWLLGMLGVTLAVAIMAGSGDGDGVDPERVTSRRTTATRAARRGAEDDKVDWVVELRSASLDSVASEYQPGRDPFRFYQPPRKPDPPPPPPPVRQAPPPVQTAQAPPPQAQGPQPPPIELGYLGSFGPAERPIAVFTDGEEIYNVRLGGVIDGKFRVVNIGYESVDLAFVDFPEVPAERLPIGRANGG